ncbi:hypothetical protein MCEREM30_02689 [Paracoccaceae bacterium]
MDAGEFATIQELAKAVGLAERHVSRQLKLAYLAPKVLKRLNCEREAPTVSLRDLCFLAGGAWAEQMEMGLGGRLEAAERGRVGQPRT